MGHALNVGVDSPLSMDEMMDKGIDILLPQFKMLRDQTEFFTHLYNWFMPFYLKNPHITEALGFVDEKRSSARLSVLLQGHVLPMPIPWQTSSSLILMRYRRISLTVTMTLRMREMAARLQMRKRLLMNFS